MEIIQITDLHISKNKSESKHDCMPYDSLAKILEHISANHPQKANLVITGDLSSDFTLESYKNISFLIKQFEFNVSILPGNHDDLNMMKNICDDQIKLESLHCDNKYFSIFNFDTHIQDNVRGFINETEIQNLESELLTNRTNAIIFTHHPLIKVNSEWIDMNITENNNLLIQFMHKHNDIRFDVFSGHIHQEFFKRINNMRFYASPSTCYQFKAQSNKFSVDRHLGNGYRVISLHGKTLNTNIVRL